MKLESVNLRLLKTKILHAQGASGYLYQRTGIGEILKEGAFAFAS